MGVLENKKFKMMTIKLKIVVVFWWDKLVVHGHRKWKGTIITWQRVKQLMLEQFLLEDNE